MTGHRCPAAINIDGRHYPCDWPAVDGDHKGWAHSNREAQAIWTSSPDFDGLTGDGRTNLAVGPR